MMTADWRGEGKSSINGSGIQHHHHQQYKEEVDEETDDYQPRIYAQSDMDAWNTSYIRK
jgi:hypothetical protein